MTHDLKQIADNLSIGQEMTEEEARSFWSQLEHLIEQDFWFSFEPRGIQKRVFNAFQKHRSGYCEIFLSGPNQIGKSFTDSWLLMDAFTRRNEFRDWPKDPMFIFYICPKQEFQVQTIQANLMKHCGKYLKENLKRPPFLKNAALGAWSMLEFKNGDQMYFESFEADKKFIEGFAADLVIMDEGQQKYDYFETITQRAVSKKAPIFWTMIPDSKGLPVYQKVFSPHLEGKTFPLREVILADRNDYVAIHGEDVTQHLERTLREEVVRRKIYGEWGAAEGLVYPFNQDKHVIRPFKIPPHWTRYAVGDWANKEQKHIVGENVKRALKQSATTMNFIAVPPPGEKVYLDGGRCIEGTHKEPLYIQYEEYHSIEKQIGKWHAKNIVKLFKPNELFQMLGMDTSIDESVFQEFREVFLTHGQGLRFQRLANKRRFSKVTDKKLYGHELQKTIIAEDRFFIMSNCEHTIKEYCNYMVVEATEEPQTWGDHHIDPNRYLFNMYLGYRDPKLLSDSYDLIDDEEDEDPLDEYMKVSNRVRRHDW